MKKFLNVLFNKNEEVVLSSTNSNQYDESEQILIKSLKMKGLLTVEIVKNNLKEIIAHRAFYSVIDCLEDLNLVGCLINQSAQANLDAVLSDPYKVGEVIKILTSVNVEVQDNFDAILCYKYPSFVRAVIDALRETNLLTGEMAEANFEAIVEHPNMVTLTSCLEDLKGTELLNNRDAQANFQHVVAHKSTMIIWFIIRKLTELKLFNSTDACVYFPQIITHPDQAYIYRAVAEFSVAGLSGNTDTPILFDRILRGTSDDNIPIVSLYHGGLLDEHMAPAVVAEFLAGHSKKMKSSYDEYYSLKKCYLRLQNNKDTGFRKPGIRNINYATLASSDSKSYPGDKGCKYKFFNVEKETGQFLSETIRHNQLKEAIQFRNLVN